MIVDYKEVRSRIRAVWPNLKYIWLSDKEYEYPKMHHLLDALNRDHTERVEFRNYKSDCDDYSIQLRASVSKFFGTDDRWSRPWPFGGVKGSSFSWNINPGAHECCICLLENDILLIEPQTDTVYNINSDKDKPFKVEMP